MCICVLFFSALPLHTQTWSYNQNSGYEIGIEAATARLSRAIKFNCCIILISSVISHLLNLYAKIIYIFACFSPLFHTLCHYRPLPVHAIEPEYARKLMIKQYQTDNAHHTPMSNFFVVVILFFYYLCSPFQSFDPTSAKLSAESYHPSISIKSKCCMVFLSQ